MDFTVLTEHFVVVVVVACLVVGSYQALDQGC